MGTELATRMGKIAYKNRAFSSGKQLNNFFFKRYVDQINSSVALDRLFKTPYAMRSIVNGQETHLRKVAVGEEVLYTPVYGGEKELIDEQYDDAVFVGMEATDNALVQLKEKINEIIDDFITADKMARIKTAINCYFEGKFQQVDENGTVKELDFERDASLSFAYNFTTSGNTMNLCLASMVSKLGAFGCPKQKLGLLAGQNWINDIELDTDIQAKITKYDNSKMMNIDPKMFKGYEGLYLYGWYIPNGLSYPIYIFTYDPDWLYSVDGTNTSAWINANQACMFNMGMQNYEIDCGKSAKVNGKKTIVKGKLAISNMVKDDPVAEYIIGRNRYVQIVTNINHTCRCTGTFS